MGRAHHVLLILACACACACAWGLIAAAPASAFPTIDCDPGTNPDANVWDATAGNWSDPAHWSQGSVPDASDHVCVDGSATLDVDADVDLLFASDLVIPSGRSITARWASISMVTVAGTLTIGGDPTSELTGDVIVTGTLELDGAVTLAGVSVSGLAGATTTIDASEAVTVDSIATQGSLALTGPGRVSMSGIAQVGGSVSGTPTASLAADSLHVGNAAGDAAISAMLSINGLTLSGPVLVTGDVDVGLLQFDDEVELRGIALTAPSTPFSVDGSSANARLTLSQETTAHDLGTIWIEDADVALTACAMNAGTTGMYSYSGRIEVHDIDCIDPMIGTTRNIAGTGVAFMANGSLDGGGTLELADDVYVGAGTVLTDGATEVATTSDTRFLVDGAGTARIVSLFSGTPLPDAYMTFHAAAGQTLHLDTPSGGLGLHADFRFADASGGGRVEVHDPSPRATSWFGGEIANAGSEPVRYVAGGTAYEPQRFWVHLDGGAWTPTGTGRSFELLGHGTVTGSIDAGTVQADSGTLTLAGSLVAESVSVRHLAGSSTSVLDLTGATNQQIGAFAVIGPSSPAPIPNAVFGDTRIATPGIMRSFAGITATRITVPAGLAWHVAAGTGALTLDDGIAPSAVGALTSGSHVSASPDPTIDASWTAATDAGSSPVAGYAVSFSQAADGDPGTTITTTATSATSGTLTAGAWWVHVRALDALGNVGPVAHAGPFTIWPQDAPLTAVTLAPRAAVMWGTHTQFRWSIADGQIVDRQRIETRADDARGIGTWRSAAFGLARRTADIAPLPGRRSCLRIVLVNWSSTARSAPACTIHPFDDRDLGTGRGFLVAPMRGAHGGTARQARTAGSLLPIPVQRARSLTIVATTCARCGTVRILQGSRVLATRSLATRRTVARASITIALRTGTSRLPLTLVTATDGLVRIDAILPRW